MPYAAKTLKQRQPRAKEYRGSREYDKSRWKKARIAYLKQNPLCVECANAGTVEAANVVDHIIPHRNDMGIFWDVSNWQSLCTMHHNQKTGRGE